MLTAAFAATLLAATTAQYDTTSTRDRVLAEPKPWPTNRVDSPDRAENGRLWHSRSPIGNRTPLSEQWHNRLGAAAYGAPPEWNDAVIYARVNHAAIAISPWQTFDDIGYDNFRMAQNIWLREQGWVLGVRTHVNAMYASEPTADAGAITPRATIEIHRDPSAPSFPSKMRVDATERVFKPMSAGAPVAYRVIEPAPIETEEKTEIAQAEKSEADEG